MKPQATHFDEIAVEYDDSIPAHVMRHLTERRVALAESLVPAGRLLDVGCGTGRFLSAISPRYEKVGIDVSAEMLERAREQGLEVVESSSGELPFPDDSFDLVTTFAVLHHLIDPALVDSTLREIVRVTRPGGAAIVWDHNPSNPYWKLLMARLPQDQGDEVLVPARQIRTTLSQLPIAGFSLRRMTFVPDFTPPRALPAMSALERVLERVPLVNLIAAHNVFVVRV